jgi:phosphatidylinositol-3-phosphatase
MSLRPMTQLFKRPRIALALGAALLLAGFPPPADADSNAPVVVIMMENHGYGPNDVGVKGDPTKFIVGNSADAPYFNGTLIPSGTLFTNYHARYHPSLPDYLELTAGTNAGCIDDACPRDSIPNENLFHQLGQAGMSFASLEESMPVNCRLSDSSSYIVHHNPETYFTDVDATSGSSYACPNTDMAIAPASTPGAPLAWPNPLPAFSLITPNRCDDMHGTSATGICPSATHQIITTGDTWLGANVPALLAEGAIVIVTFDEAPGDNTGGGGHVATVMAGPNVAAGALDATSYGHASLLAGLQDYFGVTPLLGDASTATPIAIPRSTPYPAPAISGFTPAAGATDDPVTITGLGLTNAYAVRFSGTAARFTVDSDSSLTATVPYGAASGPVSVSTVGGSAFSPQSFTISGGPPPPALVQHAVAGGLSATVASATWPQTTAAGDLLVAAVGWYGTATVTPPSGWALAISSGNGAIYYRQNAPPTSGASTFSFSVKADWVVSVSEWSGYATSGALDTTAHATSGQATGTIASTGTTKVTAQPIELVIAVVRAAPTVSESAPTNGFTPLDQLNAGTNNAMGTYYLASTSRAARSMAVTLSAQSRWRGVIATFRSS